MAALPTPWPHRSLRPSTPPCRRHHPAPRLPPCGRLTAAPAIRRRLLFDLPPPAAPPTPTPTPTPTPSPPRPLPTASAHTSQFRPGSTSNLAWTLGFSAGLKPWEQNPHPNPQPPAAATNPEPPAAATPGPKSNLNSNSPTALASSIDAYPPPPQHADVAAAAAAGPAGSASAGAAPPAAANPPGLEDLDMEYSLCPGAPGGAGADPAAMQRAAPMQPQAPPPAMQPGEASAAMQPQAPPPAMRPGDVSAAMQPSELARALWSLSASKGRQQRQQSNNLAALITPHVYDLRPQDIASTAWSLAVLGNNDQALLAGLCAAAQQLLPRFCPRALSALLWALSSLGAAAPQLFRAAAAQLPQQLPRYQPRELALVAWACANVGHRDAALMRAIAWEAQGRIQAFESSELALLLWSVAQGSDVTGPSVEGAYYVLRKRLELELGEWDLKEVASTLWALASSSQYDRQLFCCVCSGLLQPQRLPRLLASPAALDTVLGALAVGRHYDRRLCAEVAARLGGARLTGAAAPAPDAGAVQVQPAAAVQVQPAAGVSKEPPEDGDSKEPGGVPALRLSPAQGASVVASLASLNHDGPAACAALASQLLLLMERTNVQLPLPVLTSCLWALAVMDCRHFAFIQAAAQHMPRLGLRLTRGRHALQQQHQQQKQQRRGGALRSREALHLVQAIMWLQDMGCPESRRALRAFHPDLLTEAQRMWRSGAQHTTTISPMQHQVLTALRQHLGVRPKMEAMTSDRMFSIDMVVQWEGVDVAVEVNGPQHYARTSGDEEAEVTAAAAASSAAGVRPRPVPMGPRGGPDPNPDLSSGVHTSGVHTSGVHTSGVGFEARRAGGVDRGAGAARVGDGAAGQVLHPLGKKVLRDRFLRRRGFAVANVSWLEWEAVAGVPEKVRSYLLKLLDAAAAT